MDQQSFWTLNLVRYAKIGDVEGILTALEKDADIHYQGDSALQWACNNGNFDAAKCLLENGADPLGPVPIRCAAQNGHTDILRLLLEYGADYTTLPEEEKLRHMELLVAFRTENKERRLTDPYQILNDNVVVKFEGQAEKLGELCKIFDFAARTVTQTVDKHPAHPLMFDDFRNNRGEIMAAYDWLKKQGKDVPHPFITGNTRNIRRR